MTAADENAGVQRVGSQAGPDGTRTHTDTVSFQGRVVALLWRAPCVRRTGEMWVCDVAGTEEGGTLRMAAGCPICLQHW